MDYCSNGIICNICGSTRIYKKFPLREFDLLQCKGCSLAFLSQIPTAEKIEKLYSSDYYLEREEYFFKNIIVSPENGQHNENIEAFSQGIRKLNSLRPSKGRILDIGCGLGIFLHMAKKDGWDTSGVDVSPYAVRYAKEKFGLNAYNSATLEGVAFDSNSFDVVTLWDSLEHFSDPLGQFTEINRILKSDGLVMLDIPNEASLLRKVSRILYLMTFGFFTYPVRKLYHKYHLFYFSLKAVETLLKRTGFKIVSLERKTIPIVKARGSSVEKTLVKLFSAIERMLGMEYELVIVARKL